MPHSPAGMSSLKAALARTQATLAANSGKPRDNPLLTDSATAALRAGSSRGGGGGNNTSTNGAVGGGSSSSRSSTHNSSVAPTSPAVARLLRQHDLAMTGQPLVPRGLPEYGGAGRQEDSALAESAHVRQALADAEATHAAEVGQLRAKADHLTKQLRDQHAAHLDEVRHLRAGLQDAQAQVHDQKQELEALRQRVAAAELRAEQVEAREQLREDDSALQRAREAAEARRADTAEAAAGSARATAADYFGRLTAALERTWALEAEAKQLRSAVPAVASAVAAATTTPVVASSSGSNLQAVFARSTHAAAGQRTASLQRLVAAQAQRLRDTAARLEEVRQEAGRTAQRAERAEADARRDREARVQAEHQNHLVAAERDMAAKAIRDMQENLVGRLEARVEELSGLLLSQTAALEEASLDGEGLRAELQRKETQIREHEAAMQKATALQRRIMGSRWFHLFGQLEQE